MFVASAKQMKQYDVGLLKEGYSIERLVDYASDCLLRHCLDYQKYAIICGSGNNGADGISLAHKLKKLDKDIAIYLVGDVTKASTANFYYLRQAKNDNLTIVEVKTRRDLVGLQKVDIIIDAILGFGLNSTPHGIIGETITYINNLDTDVIAVDTPTGLNVDTGKAFPICILADKTISLTSLKKGFLNPEAKTYTGEVIVELLDCKDLREELGLARLVDQKFLSGCLKPLDYYAHKGNHGKVLHLTGSDDYKGASLLSAKAAVYSGSGLVSVCSEVTVLKNLTSYVPEAVSFVREDEITSTLINNYDAVLIGCGLGLSEQAKKYVEAVLTKGEVPLVIDADALTIVAQNKLWLKAYDKLVILTPHYGEFKRLCPEFSEDNLEDAARMFAKEYDVVLVLKGPNTLITDGKKVFRNTTGNPAMATAGSGDVLAGMISSLLGQKYQPLMSALLAVYLHGACGDALAAGHYIVPASKLINEIPEEMKKMILE